jgi:hypothetical protein
MGWHGLAWASWDGMIWHGLAWYNITLPKNAHSMKNRPRADILGSYAHAPIWLKLGWINLYPAFFFLTLRPEMPPSRRNRLRPRVFGLVHALIGLNKNVVA